MTAPLRFGLIGAGRWGRNIIRTLAEMRDVVLARLASGNPGSAALVPTCCPVERDWRKVAAAEDIDGLIIAAPAACHAEIAAGSWVTRMATRDRDTSGPEIPIKHRTTV